MIGHIKKPAFTLLEVIVSVAIFAVIILASSQIFQSVISSQVKNFSETALQDEVKYFLEAFSREVRGAKKNTSGGTICDSLIPSGSTYIVDSGSLYFQNKLDECIRYYVSADTNGVNRLTLSQNSFSFYVSSDKIDIDKIDFIVSDSDTVQPLVTVNFTVKSKTNPNLPTLNIQTSVSSGWYAD
ncbi:MAG: prepilin-type N-terminal cleavage/methylation domain-containing protein [Candidatus Falkowbacteria bacterium]